jgi:hypothetical protein
MVSNMFIWLASLYGFRLLRRLRNRSLHSSIRNFLLLCSSEAMFRGLGFVWVMRAGLDAFRRAVTAQKDG